MRIFEQSARRGEAHRLGVSVPPRVYALRGDGDIFKLARERDGKYLFVVPL